MAVATFDTLKFANTLKAGVPPAQAEAEAQAFAEVVQLNLKELVTKDDLAAATKELKQEITDAKNVAKQDLKDAEQRLNSKIDNATAELKVQLAQVKGELVLIRWMLGVTVGGIVAILIRLFLMRGPIS
ncbi:DUF1640 domain-containing protein [Frigoriglobus tundricola]|uniref:DUF1640 domain-containing protein n=1 Tax=Frigoriglobus tundricola TaxID=2774151 RepID=A0A6M5YNE6_9BACT|nr:DUF1640 domain-containing protein [Frigoriglobus tundricola]QJW95064.1 hypothetical protein FTUN_2590 [Frigoriglobus tundricola]